MPQKSRFRLKLASPHAECRYAELAFTDFIAEPEGQTPSLSDPIITPICGNNIDYGHLFAYLFRRFGYPNAAWDNRKNLARYILTTPHPDLLLEIIPCTSVYARLALRFLVPSKTWRSLEEQRWRASRAWKERALLWRERQGLPDWVRDWRDAANRSAAESGTAPLTWHDAFVDAIWCASDPAIAAQARAFIQELTDEYHKIEPDPGRLWRGQDWNRWADDDPLKPLAEAAQIALQDLYRPVRIRDSAINAFGRSDDYRHAVDEPPVAGFPSGDLGNRAPKEFAELHDMILKLGKGNAKKGIAKVIEALAQ